MSSHTLEPVSLTAITDARQRIAGAVANTPCPEAMALGELTGCRVFCKLEYLQRTGSFKERGAANALIQLADDQRQRGVIAASAGNHALALACHGRRLNIPVTVVMPAYAPLIKVSTCRQLGATVISHGESFSEARAHADALAQQQAMTYIHGYDDADIIAGQGTLGFELLEQVPEMDAVIVPVGGAGLIAGVATAIKAHRPDVQIIGVESANMPGFSAAMKAGKPVTIATQSSLADGLAVGCVGERAFATVQGKVDRVLTVDETTLALAVLRLMELEKAVVEGAGAVPLAALLSGQLPELTGKTVVLPLCGGNIDPLVMRRMIESGLAHDGRLSKLVLAISDRPGGLARLTELIARCGASIQDIQHDRIFAGPDAASVRVHCVVETHDADHRDRLIAELSQAGFGIETSR